MKHILGFILLVMSFGANAGMMDADGNPIANDIDLGAMLLQVSNYDIADVTLHCALKGYFIYDSTIYMCVKIQENVSKSELRAYTIKDNALQEKKRIARDKWYKKWIKTEEGRTWEKEYKRKLKLK